MNRLKIKGLHQQLTTVHVDTNDYNMQLSITERCFTFFPKWYAALILIDLSTHSQQRSRLSYFSNTDEKKEEGHMSQRHCAALTSALWPQPNPVMTSPGRPEFGEALQVTSSIRTPMSSTAVRSCILHHSCFLFIFCLSHSLSACTLLSQTSASIYYTLCLTLSIPLHLW